MSKVKNLTTLTYKRVRKQRRQRQKWRFPGYTQRNAQQIFPSDDRFSEPRQANGNRPRMSGWRQQTQDPRLKFSKFE